MIEFTEIEARKNFENMLDKAEKTGSILIRREDGSKFIVTPFNQDQYPIDIDSLDLKNDLDEITCMVREIRKKEHGNYNRYV